MSVPETLAAGKAKPSPWTANQAVNIPYSDTALNSLIGGVLALASWTVWAYWSRPQHAGARGVILVLIPFVWIAAKIWLSRRCVPDDSATNAKRRRRWKLGLAILVSLVCVVCWYAWSSIWLSTVPQLSTAPRMWQMLVYLSQLMHQPILPVSFFVFITSFPLIVWFFGDSGLELFVGISATMAAWDGVVGSVPASSAGNLIVPLCALLLMLQGMKKLRAESSGPQVTLQPAPNTMPVRIQSGKETGRGREFCCPSGQA